MRLAMPLTVEACGMVSAVGYNAPASLAALRAGVSGVRTQAWADTETATPYRCARVSLPQRWGGSGLLADLVAPAIHECLQGLAPAEAEAAPWLIGVSCPERPGRPDDLEAALLDAVAARLDRTVPAGSRVLPHDQTGCARALFHAAQWLAAGDVAHAVVAGVDSFVDRRTLEAFEARQRVLTPTHFNGFLPGEAGTAVRVSGRPVTAGEVCIAGAGTALERATIDSTAPFRGEAMTQAVREALADAGLGMEHIGYRVTDLSGEHYKFKEAMFAVMRLDPLPRAQPLDLWHPIEYLGEVGAAILPALVAWAAHAARHGYAPGANALCHVGSDAGERAAFVVRQGEAAP